MSTEPTKVSVQKFLESVGVVRREEAEIIIKLMHEISSEKPVMWGQSIIGFGTLHYKYETGREGDMPLLAFSPRKANLTFYFQGFNQYGDLLAELGTYKQSVSCLYVNKLSEINLEVLRDMLERLYSSVRLPVDTPDTVEEYIKNIPIAARPQFDELRLIVKECLPDANEVLSYGIVGYKVDTKRARVYISGWKDHLAIYPVPSNQDLQSELAPYIKGKGTLWFKLNEQLPKSLIEKTVNALASQ